MQKIETLLVSSEVLTTKVRQGVIPC